MKKFFKALALVLALALVIGVVPAQATSAKIKAKKTLYVDGAKGTSTDGKLTSSYKSRVAIYKLAGDKKSVAADHTYKAVIKSGDSVTKTKKYVYAADLGKSVVEIFKDGESLGTSVITVKKNATEDTLTITELEDGKEVVCGVKYTVTLPRKGVDSDERRLFVDDKAVADKEDAPRAYEVVFTTAGDHKVKFEAFQSAELDKATASKEITVKAIMPQPVSAKQVSANSFAVTFDGEMTDLIDKDKISNQDIYYLIASQPVVTGVIKSVTVSKEDAKVVEIEMHANFNADTDYYFAYGDAEPVKFHTAINELKYATSLKLVEAAAYYVGTETNIEYKFFNDNGVELKIDDLPSLEVTSDYAYGIGTKIYFHSVGTATIKASIVTGYDDETNKAIILTDTVTVSGVEKTATQTGKVYSFNGTATDAKHSIRVNTAANASVLAVQYTLSDGTKAIVKSTDDGYSIKSTDETVAMISANKVYGINVGSATIVLYKGKDVVDAFPITVLEANKVGSATVELSKNTLNLDIADTIELKVVGKDLDGEDSGAYSVSIAQLDNNKEATSVTYTPGAPAAFTAVNGAAERKLDITSAIINPGDARTDKTGFATVRAVVIVKDTAGKEVVNKVVSFVVSKQHEANSYKLVADQTALDTSLKNFGTKDLSTVASTIKVASVKTTSYGDFTVNPSLSFELVKSVGSIPVTGATGTAVNYVIYSTPKAVGELVANTFVPTNALNAEGASSNNTQVVVDGFPTATTRGDAGTYTFTGYHVAFGNDYKGVRTSLGSANVVISKSDVQATVEIVDGTATAFAKVVNGTELPTTVFKVSWDGKTTNDTNTLGRVKILDLALNTNYTYDDVTSSYYCKKIKVTVVLDNDASGNPGTYTFDQEITINKLFKDK